MKFPYAVKYNGVIYPANTEIEEVKPEPIEEVKGSNEAKSTPKKKKISKGDE